MQGRSSYLTKSMVACLALLGGAGVGGLAAGFNARAGLTPEPSSAVLATVAQMAPAGTVNLRFPANWTEAAAEAAPQVAPQKVALASADSRIVLFSPKPAYPITDEPVAAAEPAAKSKPAAQAAVPVPTAKPPAPKPVVHRSNAVLNDAQIASIKKRLNLTPDAELRKMEYAKRSGAAAPRTASVDMSKVNVEGLKSAGYPLVMSFSDDQRRELRSLAHLLGLEDVMAGL